MSANNQERAVNELRASMEAKELVVITGTGVSRALAGSAHDELSWRGLIRSGLNEALERGALDGIQLARWNSQLESSDIDELLSAAEFMGRKLGAPHGATYQRWLKNCFSSVSHVSGAMSSALIKLSGINPLFATLNYDTLLETVLEKPSVDLSDLDGTIQWARNERSGILHLHGLWNKPETCVLGIRDYEKTLLSETRNLTQRFISSFKRILFIGCGDTFEDPNFTNLIKWLRSEMGSSQPQHYALVTTTEAAARMQDPAWRDFVDPVSFGKDHSDLPAFISDLVAGIVSEVPVKYSTIKLDHERTLAAYRSFLLRDCGQMTIEGIKADLDTAQRKFDIERLFVPLSVVPCPPNFPTNDPERETKIEEWATTNPVTKFGDELSQSKRIAILALPGGGKSLLLKRLAVAYADPSRRYHSQDCLPDIDVTPILIRCREWRDYIRLPITTLLSKMRDVSGDEKLSTFHEAIFPLLSEGKVLLLVDGLDEIHDNADRQTFSSHLEEFIESFPDIRVIVTSREAGFDLVAPSIARFCKRIRICPLSPEAIKLLTRHWHLLMTGDTPESNSEAGIVANSLLKSPSLQRLSENPLLLTMLLVVKHGAGRLPPDRVSLYERAVEVLLDTWNIRGHEPLNTKEAMPQLSCIAFEMMRRGVQTATEKELLGILDLAREKVPYIKRYAKGTPHEFLKRVELRSSLLVEAGHQLDGIRIVPIYQFRHLTFQEYLAAVAASEGHYLGYEEGLTVLDALKEKMFEKEWREIVPMAAVLARKQAEPLLKEIVIRARRDKENRNRKGRKDREVSNRGGANPSNAASLLIQCLVEETEVFPKTLRSILDLIAYFGGGCTSEDEWATLAKGPFGEELIERAIHLYRNSSWRLSGWVRNTVGSLLSFQRGFVDCCSPSGVEATIDLLNSPSDDLITRGLLINLGALWQRDGTRVDEESAETLIIAIEQHVFSSSNFILLSSIASWAFMRRAHPALTQPSATVLDRIVSLALNSEDIGVKDTAAFAVTVIRVERKDWTPALNDRDRIEITKGASMSANSAGDDAYTRAAALFLCYYSRSLRDEAIAKLLGRERQSPVSLRWLQEEIGLKKKPTRQPPKTTRQNSTILDS